MLLRVRVKLLCGSVSALNKKKAWDESKEINKVGDAKTIKK
jgi:hypothetical protein